MNTEAITREVKPVHVGKQSGTPGSGPKRRARQKFAQTVRRKRVAGMYLEGKSQQEIAKIVGVDQKTVSTDVARVNAEILQETAHLVEQWREQQVKRLEAYRDELLAEWHRSKQPFRETRIEREVGADGQPLKDAEGRPASGAKSSVVQHERIAHKPLMDALLTIEDMIAKLRGTYAPRPPDGSGGNGAEKPLLSGNIMVIRVGR